MPNPFDIAEQRLAAEDFAAGKIAVSSPSREEPAGYPSMYGAPPQEPAANPFDVAEDYLGERDRHERLRALPSPEKIMAEDFIGATQVAPEHKADLERIYKGIFERGRDLLSDQDVYDAYKALPEKQRRAVDKTLAVSGVAAWTGAELRRRDELRQKAADESAWNAQKAPEYKALGMAFTPLGTAKQALEEAQRQEHRRLNGGTIDRNAPAPAWLDETLARESLARAQEIMPSLADPASAQSREVEHMRQLGLGPAHTWRAMKGADIGDWWNQGQEAWAKKVPITGRMITADELRPVSQAVERIQADRDGTVALNPEQKAKDTAIVERHMMKLRYAAAASDKMSTAARVAEGVTDSARYMAEWWTLNKLLGGAPRGAGLALRGALRGALPAALAKGAGKLAETTISAAGVTALQTGDIIASYHQNVINGSKPSAALYKAIGSQFLANVAEQSGGILNKGLSKIPGAKVLQERFLGSLNKLLGEKGMKTLSGLGDSIQWHGMPAELFEEHAEDLLKATFRTEDDATFAKALWPGLSEEIDRVLVLGTLQGGQAAPVAAARGAAALYRAGRLDPNDRRQVLMSRGVSAEDADRIITEQEMAESDQKAAGVPAKVERVAAETSARSDAIQGAASALKDLRGPGTTIPADAVDEITQRFQLTPDERQQAFEVAFQPSAPQPVAAEQPAPGPAPSTPQAEATGPAAPPAGREAPAPSAQPQAAIEAAPAGEANTPEVQAAAERARAGFEAAAQPKAFDAETAPIKDVRAQATPEEIKAHGLQPAALRAAVKARMAGQAPAAPKRKLAKDMTFDELGVKLQTNPVSGLANGLAYAHRPKVAKGEYGLTHEVDVNLPVKAVNDAIDHPAGNRVKAAAGEFARTQLQAGVIVYDMGGGNFIVTADNQAKARQAASWISAYVNDLPEVKKVGAKVTAPETPHYRPGEPAKRIEHMTHEERLHAYTHSDVTGLPNSIAFFDQEDGPAVSIDVRRLGSTSKELGRETGDKLLRAIADVATALKLDVYHLHGDEFALKGTSEAELEKQMEALTKALESVRISGRDKDGNPKSVQVEVTHGTGPDFATADAAAARNKAAAKLSEAEGRAPAQPEVPGRAGAAGPEVSDQGVRGGQGNQVTEQPAPVVEPPQPDPKFKPGNLTYNDMRKHLLAVGASEVEAEAILRLVAARAAVLQMTPDAYIAMRIAEVKKGTKGEAADAFQKSGKRRLAQVEFKDGKAIISVFKTPQTAASLAHELAHIFRRDLPAAELAIVEEYYLVENGQWTKEAEERFAKEFEGYLVLGKAPTAELRGIFALFQSWMRALWQTISRGGMTLSPEVRGVFDRMLGGTTEAAPTEAASRRPAESLRPTSRFGSTLQGYWESGKTGKQVNEFLARATDAEIEEAYTDTGVRGDLDAAVRQERAVRRGRAEDKAVAEKKAAAAPASPSDHEALTSHLRKNGVPLTAAPSSARKFLELLAAGDAKEITGYLHFNKITRGWFKARFGVKLPDTKKGILPAIEKWLKFRAAGGKVGEVESGKQIKAAGWDTHSRIGKNNDIRAERGSEFTPWRKSLAEVWLDVQAAEKPAAPSGPLNIAGAEADYRKALEAGNETLAKEIEAKVVQELSSEDDRQIKAADGALGRMGEFRRKWARSLGERKPAAPAQAPMSEDEIAKLLDDEMAKTEAPKPAVTFKKAAIHMTRDGGVVAVPIKSDAEVEADKAIQELKDLLGQDVDLAETPEFKRWFGESVVTENGKPGGKPLVVYHGTSESFDAFVLGEEGMIFFTSNKEAAEDYGDRVVEAFLRIRRPYKVSPEMWHKGSGPSRAQAEARGYDGFIIEGHDIGGDPTPDTVFSTVGDTYIAFSPTQIKSATANRGTFDPKNPDILAQDVEIDPRVRSAVAKAAAKLIAAGKLDFAEVVGKLAAALGREKTLSIAPALEAAWAKLHALDQTRRVSAAGPLGPAGKVADVLKEAEPKAPAAPEQTFEEFAKEYRRTLKDLLTYDGPLNNRAFSEKLGKMADEHPDWVERIEAEEEAKAARPGGGTVTTPPATPAESAPPRADLPAWRARMLEGKGYVVVVKPAGELNGARALFDPLTAELHVAEDLTEAEAAAIEGQEFHRLNMTDRDVTLDGAPVKAMKTARALSRRLANLRAVLDCLGRK